MTAKENFRAFFAGQPYEWRPMNSDVLKFNPEEFPDNPCRGFVSQQEPYTGGFGGKGWFDVEWEYVPQVRGSIDKGRQIDAIDEWKKVRFIPLDSYDWEGIAKRNAEYLNTDKPIQTTIFTGYFERLISLMDFSDAIMTLIDEDMEEDLLEFFDKLTEYYIDFITRCKKYFNIDMLELHDDWGSQRAPLMSKETHKKVLQPFIKRVVDACHRQGVIFFMHSCGHIEEIFENLIETGADTWLGQHGANDKVAMVNKYPNFRFAVSVRPDAHDDLDSAMKDAMDMLAQYDGKEVWFFVDCRNLDPSIRKTVTDAVVARIKNK